MANEVLSEVASRWHEIRPLLRGSLETLTVILVCVGLRAALLKLVRKQVEDPTTYYRWRKGSQYVAVAIASALIASIWFQGTKDLATYLGLLSAGIAVALKDPLANLAGWAFIMWQNPFSVGDRIEIQQVRGDIIDLRFFAFTMLEVGNWVHGEQSTGRIVHVPNAHVFGHTLYNYTQEFQFIWDELLITVTFESDWERARALLVDIASKRAELIVPIAKEELDRTSQKTLIQFQNLSPIVYVTGEPNGITLALRYIVRTRQRRMEQQALWEALLTALRDEPGIRLAYPASNVMVTPVTRAGAVLGGPPT
jgi:small-conductance mechanosensitive channel